MMQVASRIRSEAGQCAAKKAPRYRNLGLVGGGGPYNLLFLAFHAMKRSLEDGFVNYQPVRFHISYSATPGGRIFSSEACPLVPHN